MVIAFHTSLVCSAEQDPSPVKLSLFLGAKHA